MNDVNYGGGKGERCIHYSRPQSLSKDSYLYPLIWLKLAPIHFLFCPVLFWLLVWAHGASKTSSRELQPTSGFYGLLFSVLSRVILQKTHRSPNHTFPYPKIWPRFTTQGSPADERNEPSTLIFFFPWWKSHSALFILQLGFEKKPAPFADKKETSGIPFRKLFTLAGSLIPVHLMPFN